MEYDTSDMEFENAEGWKELLEKAKNAAAKAKAAAGGLKKRASSAAKNAAKNGKANAKGRWKKLAASHGMDKKATYNSWEEQQKGILKIFKRYFEQVQGGISKHATGKKAYKQYLTGRDINAEETQLKKFCKVIGPGKKTLEEVIKLYIQIGKKPTGAAAAEGENPAGGEDGGEDE